MDLLKIETWFSKVAFMSLNSWVNGPLITILYSQYRPLLKSSKVERKDGCAEENPGCVGVE